jgi:hypothetical protein
MSFFKSLHAAADAEGIKLSDAIELYVSGNLAPGLKPTAEDASEFLTRIAMMQRVIQAERARPADEKDEKKSSGDKIGKELGIKFGKVNIKPAEIYRDKIEDRDSLLHAMLLESGYDDRELACLVKRLEGGRDSASARFIDLQFASGVAIALDELGYTAGITSQTSMVDFYGPDLEDSKKICLHQIDHAQIHVVTASVFPAEKRMEFRPRGGGYISLDPKNPTHPTKGRLDAMLGLLHAGEKRSSGLTDPAISPDGLSLYAGKV